MLRRSSSSLGALVIALTCAAALYGSLDRGIIQGTITDSQGALVPNAKVVVKNMATNVQSVLTTNSDGFYLAPQLVPGQYSIQVSGSGFEALEISNVTVTAGVTTTANGQLKLGSTTQRVEVTAASPLVEGTPSNFTTAISNTYIQNIPLPGRDIQALVQLLPGVTQSTGPSGSLFGFDSQFGGFPDPLHIVGSAIDANGSQAGANAWYLDGNLNAALGAENVVVSPSPDAVSEFNAVNNGLAAEYGFTSGAVVNVVLKSGSNQIHGNTYEFNRNSFFNATNPFARRDAQGRPFLEPAVNFNNFGGTIGGPLVIPHVYNGRNRTFFFGSIDVITLHETKPTISTVPLPNERNGDFTGDPRFAPVCGVNGAANCLYDPLTTVGPNAVTGQFSRTAFPTPMIPSNRIDPVAAFYISSFPNPNFLDPLQQGPNGCGNLCNNFLGSVGSGQTTYNTSLKIDHSISERQKLFFEWLYNPTSYSLFRLPWTGPTAQVQQGIAGAMPYAAKNDIFALGLTSSFSSTLINEARISYSRQAEIPRPNPDSLVATSEVLQKTLPLNLNLVQPFSPGPDISGGSDLGFFGPQPWENAIEGEDAVTVLDNLTKVLGRHTIKTGFMYRRVRAWDLDSFPTTLSFSGGLTNNPVNLQGGSSLAQFLLGAVDEGSTTGIFHSPFNTVGEWGFYGQDDFRIRPDLTLSLGLRYDIFGWPNERHNDEGLVNFNIPNPVVNAPGAVVYLGTPQHPSRNLYPANKGDFGPRFSFAWSPFGSHNTVIRGGFGLIYSDAAEAQFSPQNGASSTVGFSQRVGYTGDFSFERPAFILSQGAPANIQIPDLNMVRSQDQQFLGQNVATNLQAPKDPYVEQWSFFVERQLPADSMISVGYVGTHGTHLIGDSFRTLNPVPTATRLALRGNINNPVPTDPTIGAIYGCGTSCPGSLVLKAFPEWDPLTDTVSPDGYNRYDAFEAKFEKRYSHGLNVLVAYTIQKNIVSPNLTGLEGSNLSPTIFGRGVGRASAVNNGFSFSQGLGLPFGLEEDPSNRARYVALAPDDIPQILNIAATYQLPAGPGRPFFTHGAAAKVLGGWTLTQSWNLQSGVPLGFTAPCNAISCRPNLVGNPKAGQGSQSRQQLENQYFNPNAFEAPFGSDPTVIQEITTGLTPQGTPLNFNTLDQWWQFGNSAAVLGSARAPGFWGADMAITKDMHFSESRYLQFRWEVINALNHQSLGLPNTNWCLPPGPGGQVDAIHVFGCQFGKITNVQIDPRAMEFALKLYW